MDSHQTNHHFKKYIIFICTALLFSAAVCIGFIFLSQAAVEVSITEPVGYCDPMLKISEDGFVLYQNGSNNFTDDILGYFPADSVPEKYNNYETLLNHNGSYNMPELQDFSSDCVSYDFISSLEKAKEGRFDLFNYSVSTLMPGELKEENSFFEKKSVDERDGSERIYSFAEGKDSLFFNAVQTQGERVDTNEFLKYFEAPDPEKWSYFLTDLFTVPDGASFQFDSDDAFYTMNCDCVLHMTLLQQPYTGRLIVSLDREDGTFLLSFMGYTDTLLENEEDGTFSRKSLLESFPLRYTVEKNASGTGSAGSLESLFKKAEDIDTRYFPDVVSDMDVLTDYDYFSYDLLPEGNEDEEKLKELVAPSLIQLSLFNSEGQSFSSGFIYRIEEDFIYCITAGHCYEMLENGGKIMFFNGETVKNSASGPEYALSDDADLCVFRIQTEAVPEELLYQLKQADISTDWEELEENQPLYAYCANFMSKKGNGYFEKLYRTGQYDDILRADAEPLLDSSFLLGGRIVGGVSGSPAFDARGRVYGSYDFVMREEPASGATRLDEVEELETFLKTEQ